MTLYDPSSDKGPELLARAARAAGSRQDLTQGAGGNVSVKLNHELMLIKASGVRLKDVSPGSGYALVNYGNIRRRIASGIGGEGGFSDFIRAQALPVKGVKAARPSVETGFHALLDTVVLHTHSVYANILNMSEEGHVLGRELFPDAGFVPYLAPGAQLCSAISERSDAGRPQVFFLANHGLVVSHSGVEGALALNEKVNGTIRRRLNLPAYPASRPSAGINESNAAALARYGKTFFLENVLSPDQALYCGPEALEGGGEMEAVNEVLAALFYILAGIKAAGFTPRFLTAAEAAYFDTLESGRYGGRS